MARKIIRLPRTKEQKQANREQNQRANRTILRRTLVLMVLCGIVAFVPLIGTLYHLMITEHDYYNEKAIKNQTRSTNLTATRGVIYDANMNVLASSSTVETVFIDPNEIAEQMKQPENSNLLDQIARGLGEILDVEPSFVYEQAADKQYRYKVIKRKISEELADEVRAFISENSITGVYLETDLKRYYPNSSLAAQALGFVSSDNNGSEDLDAYSNQELSDTAGKVVTSKGNYGSEMLYTYEKYYDASDGSSLITTIDSTVQAYVEKNLQNAIDKYDIKNGAFCIVMDVNTGEIKAMATLGSYDPNNYLEIYDDTTALLLENERAAALALPEASAAYEAAIETYKQDVAAARMAQWRNRCVSDGYEPGSTFKLITLASALDSGAVTLNDSFYCGGQEKFTGREQILNCWKSAGHGAQTTAQALGNSCNIAFGHIGLRMGGDTFYDYLKSFGVMEKTGVDLPGEASLKDAYWSREKMTNVDLAVASFGQRFEVTPLQMITAFAATINGGDLVKPYVVQSVSTRDKTVVENTQPTVVRQVVSQETSQRVSKILESVVSEGTGKNAYVAGYRIGGKTGSSETQEEGRTIVSFMGFAPADDPEVIVLLAYDKPQEASPGSHYSTTGVYISGGNMAAKQAGKLIANILDYMGVEKKYTAEESAAVDVVTPQVSGMTVDAAESTLRKKGLSSRTVGEGDTVTAQIPASGASVPGGSKVILYLGSAAPEETGTVPNVVGLGYESAKKRLEDSGFFMRASGVSTYYGNSTTASGQSVASGETAPIGTVIEVQFSNVVEDGL